LQKNRVVKFTIVCEIVLDLIPTYTGFLFNLIAGYSGSSVIGDYIGIGVAVEAAFCGVYYWRLFVRGSKTRATIGGGL
jgi:hypothetical protein